MAVSEEPDVLKLSLGDELAHKVWLYYVLILVNLLYIFKIFSKIMVHVMDIGYSVSNSFLERYHTNQQSIEIQLMRRFIESMKIKSRVNTDTFIPEHLLIRIY